MVATYSRALPEGHALKSIQRFHPAQLANGDKHKSYATLGIPQ